MRFYSSKGHGACFVSVNMHMNASITVLKNGGSLSLRLIFIALRKLMVCIFLPTERKTTLDIQSHKHNDSN